LRGLKGEREHVEFRCCVIAYVQGMRFNGVSGGGSPAVVVACVRFLIALECASLRWGDELLGMCMCPMLFENKFVSVRGNLLFDA
jgi:hypothetical protein